MIWDILKIMKRFLLIIVLSLFVAGCVSWRQPKAGLLPEPAGTEYSGLKVKVAVTDFDIKAPKVTPKVASGLREIMVNTLVNSGRFIVIPKQAPSDAKEADLIISTAIIEFEPEVSGGSSGVGGGGGANSGSFGGLLGTALNKAHIALEIRIINSATSEVLFSRRVQGQALDFSGKPGGSSMDKWALGSGLSVYVNTPMEKAIRVSIEEGVHYIEQVIAKEYYKYK